MKASLSFPGDSRLKEIWSLSPFPALSVFSWFLGATVTHFLTEKKRNCSMMSCHGHYFPCHQIVTGEVILLYLSLDNINYFLTVGCCSVLQNTDLIIETRYLIRGRALVVRKSEETVVPSAASSLWLLTFPSSLIAPI